MKRTVLLFVVCPLSVMTVLAQPNQAGLSPPPLTMDSTRQASNRFMAIGTLSVGLPTNSLADIAGTAIYVSSGIEYRVTNRLTLIGMSEIWTATVILPPSPNQPVVIRGRSNNVFVSANLGLYRSVRRWTAYGLSGLGIGLISKPNVEVLGSGGYNVLAKSEWQPIWRVGAGVEYKVSNTLVPYVEGAYASTINSTILGERNFTYVSIGLGMKAYIKLKGLFNRS